MLNIICLQHYDEQIVIVRLNDAVKTIAVMSHFGKLCQFAPKTAVQAVTIKDFIIRLL